MRTEGYTVFVFYDVILANTFHNNRTLLTRSQVRLSCRFAIASTTPIAEYGKVVTFKKVGTFYLYIKNLLLCK